MKHFRWELSPTGLPMPASPMPAPCTGNSWDSSFRKKCLHLSWLADHARTLLQQNNTSDGKQDGITSSSGSNGSGSNKIGTGTGDGSGTNTGTGDSLLGSSAAIVTTDEGASGSTTPSSNTALTCTGGEWGWRMSSPADFHRQHLQFAAHMEA